MCKEGKEVREVLAEYDLLGVYELTYISRKESSRALNILSKS